LICGLGAALGAGLGILPAFALELPGGALPFVPPWAPIATIFIALPAVIAVASWLLGGRAATVQRHVVVFWVTHSRIPRGCALTASLRRLEEEHSWRWGTIAAGRARSQ